MATQYPNVPTTEMPMVGKILPDSSPYNNQPRTAKDKFWAGLYLTVLLVSIAIGGYGKSNVTEIDVSDIQNWPASECPAADNGAAAGLAARTKAGDYADYAKPGADFLTYTKTPLSVSVSAALVLGIAYIVLLKNFARTMVKVTAAVTILAPALMGAYIFSLEPETSDYGEVVDNKPAAYAMFAVAAVFALIAYLLRHQLELCGRLLEVAAAGLKSNPGIILVVLLLKALLLAVLVTLLVLLIPLFANGDAVRSTQVMSVDNDECYSSVEPGNPFDKVPCCAFALYGYAVGGIAMNIFTIYWSIFLVFEMRLYTIAGCIAQWYWAPAGSSTRGMTTKPLKEAFTTAFGSLCAGGLILLIATWLQSTVRRLRKKMNPVARILSYCLNALLEFVKFLTKFTTIQCAISGDHFCAAGKRITGLLARNALSTTTVWWVPGAVLQFTAFLLAVCNGTAVYYACKAALGDHSDVLDSVEITSFSWICTAIATFVAWIVLSFLMSILLNVVDAVFVCYAVDKENNLISQPVVHESFDQLPSTKANEHDLEHARLIEQPDASAAYSAGAYQPPPQV